MKLRNSILAGLVLAAATIIFTFGSILLNFPKVLVVLGAVVAWYGYAAIRRTSPRTTEDALVLKSGLNWGLVIASAFALGFLTPDLSALFFIPLLPFVAGAISAISSGKIFVGSRVGFWSGMIGSLCGFFLLAANEYFHAWLSGVGIFTFMEANEYGSLLLAMYALFLYGPVFCPIAATIGAWVGIRLDKTGRLIPANARL
jgi:hypothetical protein